LLLGLYTSILETDNRLVLPDGIPASYKDGMYITQGFDRNIMALTIQAFEAIYEKITSLNLADPIARLLLRMILGSAHLTTVTTDGRIEIPESLKGFAELGSEVILVGQGDFLELWSPAVWQMQVEQLLNVEANRFSSLSITTR